VNTEDLIRDLDQSCRTITHVQTSLSDWYGPDGKKLMSARAYLEREQLHPLINAILDESEGVTA